MVARVGLELALEVAVVVRGTDDEAAAEVGCAVGVEAVGMPGVVTPGEAGTPVAPAEKEE